MINWKDYVGYQPINEDDFVNQPENLNIYYYTTVNTDEGIRSAILKLPFTANDVVLTDEEVGVRVEELLLTLPKVSVKNSIDLERAKIEVVNNSRRAHPDTNYNNTWVYKGSTKYDAAIFVCGINDKYVVLTHPNFDKYGFNVV